MATQAAARGSKRNVSPVEKMHKLLEDAKEIVGGSRHKAYGSPDENHGRTAAMWQAYLSAQFIRGEMVISARDVCFMNILQKCSREAHWSQTDNALDIAGYAANAEACLAAATDGT